MFKNIIQSTLKYSHIQNLQYFKYRYFSTTNTPLENSNPNLSKPTEIELLGHLKENIVQKERLQKILSRSGVTSRRNAEILIKDGRVKVDGVVATLDTVVVSPLSKILVDDKPISSSSPKIWIHYKTTKTLVTEQDHLGRECVLPTLKSMMKYDHLIPVGRLDYYSEGLLLITNDGGLARHLELPEQFKKVYKVKIFGKISSQTMELLGRGITIDGVRYRPIEVEITSETESNQWLKIALMEGKKREIRRVLEHFNLHVTKLIRVQYGPYLLPPNLNKGDTLEVAVRPEFKQFINQWNELEKAKRVSNRLTTSIEKMKMFNNISDKK